jgi:hypothetical protein
MRRVGLAAVLLLAGCTGSDPTGPTYNITGNTAPVTVTTTTGSSSPVGTAPCGASSTQKNATTGGGPQGATPDCSVVSEAH